MSSALRVDLMKTSGTHKEQSRRGKFKKLPRAAYIWAGITSAFILILFGMYFLSYSGKSDTHPLLLIYNRSDADFYLADPAFSNTMHSCGFEYEIIDSSSNEIPERISGRSVVVMGIGKDSFALMRDINDDELGTASLLN